MINKEDVIEFFDSLAPGWDDDLVRSDRKINMILDNADVGPGSKVLDVACGTGVLIPDYLKRDVSEICAIDISPEMINVAKSKFEDSRLTFICGDVESEELDRNFDCVVVYNAFPHFPDPERLIECLSGHLRQGGTLTVAHGMSREKIDAHHSGRARNVSNGLMKAEKLAGIFSSYLNVTAVISNDEMYQVVGKKP